MNYVQIGAGAALGALLAFGPVYLAGSHNGRQQAALEASRNALKRIEQMERDNHDFRNLSDHDRCIVFMRDSGLPIDQCD